MKDCSNCHQKQAGRWRKWEQLQECEDDGRDVAQALRERKCRAVADGTYKDNEGAAGFVIQGHPVTSISCWGATGHLAEKKR